MSSQAGVLTFQGLAVVPSALRWSAQLPEQ